MSVTSSVYPQVGGQSDGQSVHEAHTTLLSEHELGEGDSFLLLLSAFDDGTYDAINPEIGVLEISKDGAARRWEIHRWTVRPSALR